MIDVLRRDERGNAQLGWLESKHSFSFGHYYDPRRMGFRALRVINEDRVIPGAGFPTHGHSDMEIVSYVLEGALEHKDTLGTTSVIRPGEVQIMSAGSGIRHSEFNHSTKDGVHFLQIWLLPDKNGGAPRYEQRAFPPAERLGKLRLVGSPAGRDGSLTIGQDVEFYASLLPEGQAVSLDLRSGRHAWVQVARGQVRVNGVSLKEGDGAAVSDETRIEILGEAASEVLVFDLA